MEKVKKSIITTLTIIFLIVIVIMGVWGFDQSVGIAAVKNHPIIVTIKGHHFQAQLNQTKAAKQFQKQLPLTMKFSDMGSGFVEKISDLKKPLSTKGTPVGADPHPGDIAYWSPQPRIVFYWGDAQYYEGIHLIGKFTSKDRRQAIKLIRQQNHDFTVKFSLKK